MGDRRRTLGEMPPRHAFRPRCRPRGVEHQRPSVGAHARRGVGGFGLHEAGEVEVRRAGHRDGDARQALGLRRGGDGCGGNVLIDDGLGFGILNAEIDLVILGAPIQRRDDDAGELTGPVDGGGLPAVLQHRDQMIAGLQSDLVERGDQRGNFRVPLPVGQPQLAVDNGQRFGIAVDARNKAGAEVKHDRAPDEVSAPHPAPL